MSARVGTREVCGWTWTQDGAPVAFVMTEGEPDSAMLIPQSSWWQAMRFALSFDHNNAAVRYIGGPGNV